MRSAKRIDELAKYEPELHKQLKTLGTIPQEL
jgi:hypothetical protein